MFAPGASASNAVIKPSCARARDRAVPPVHRRMVIVDDSEDARLSARESASSQQHTQRTQQHATYMARHDSFGDPTFEEIESACKFFCASIKKYLISSRSFYTFRVAARAGRRRASFAGPGT